MTRCCHLCQQTFDSTSAEDHLRWLLGHDCWPAEKTTAQAAKIVPVAVGPGEVMVVSLTDGKKEYIYEDGTLYQF